MTWLKRLFGRTHKSERLARTPFVEHMLEPIRTQAQLAAEIRSLIAGGREPSVQELTALQVRSRNLASEVPHLIAHWFADSDIRQRDAEYRRTQAQQLEDALRQME